MTRHLIAGLMALVVLLPAVAAAGLKTKPRPHGKTPPMTKPHVGDTGGPASRPRGLTEKGKSGRQPLGPIHELKNDTRLERWTNRPRTDKQRGLRPHSFWTKPERGPKGKAPHLRKEFNIDHPLKQREEMLAPRGTRYHERSVRGGKDGAREVIIHDRVPKHEIRSKERVRP